jgi:hypothetical protein
LIDSSVIIVMNLRLTACVTFSPYFDGEVAKS